MPGILRYDVNGYRVDISVSDPDARADVAFVMSGFDPVAYPRPDPEARFTLRYDEQLRWAIFVDGTLWYRSDDCADAIVALEWRIVTEMLQRTPGIFHLHCAALATPSGSASLLVVGESGSGKTTLTLGLMARGFQPYTDDVCIIDPATLALRAFRRAFHIDDQTRQLVHGLGIPPDWDFDAAPPGYFRPPHWSEEPTSIRTVLFASVCPDAPPRLTPLSIAEAVRTLLPFSGTLAQSPPVALSTAARLVGQAACYNLAMGGLAETVHLVTALVENDAAPGPHAVL